MAAQPVPHPSTDKKRVKVYELRNNDWFDRGTGFCTAAFHVIEDGQREPRVVVESEDQPDRILLETRVCKGDGFHKQQETLIVWTEPSNGVDMALSFQEAEGCTLIWRFIHSIQQQFRAANGHTDDSLSDDLGMDMSNPVSLPPVSLGNLAEIEAQLRMMSSSGNGRDALTKYVLTEDMIGKLCPMVGDAEDLESLNELHRLCNIMKIIILLNDTSIIEHAVSDECVIGVVGALEYDPDFPSHKANHRQWLQDASRYKEVVRIEDPQILKKVHQTYRLQYLKDVVLARILDDNTFSVLNSLIFFNQVDIVQHLQSNAAFLIDLFDIFKQPAGQDPKRKKEAVLFIQQCCAIAKNLQPPARQTLYNNFIVHGLLQVINFGLRHNDVAVRVGATDILVSMIDHDPQMIRQTIYRQINEKQPPLTDSLIDLLLIEVDLGVKSQISDALKVLLDQGPPVQPEAFAKANSEYAARAQARLPTADPQQERFLELFYEQSAVRLFQPLISLKDRANMEFTAQQASMFTYLIEILCFFIRQHHTRSKYFVLTNDIVQRIAQLLGSSEKFLKLVAVRFLRQLIGIQDEFYVKHLSEKKVIGSILDVLESTMPRDNLVSSACLEFFEHIKKESIKDLIKHVVENYREKVERLAYVELFRHILTRYDQTRGFTVNLDYFLESEDDVSRRRNNINPRTGALMEHITMDQAEEEYWNTSDDEEEMHIKAGNRAAANGTSPATRLVDYASDEDVDENIDEAELGPEDKALDDSMDDDDSSKLEGGLVSTPPERLSEKRRREEDEEDDLGKLISHKRRNSTPASANSSTTSGVLRKKKGAATPRDAGGGGGGPKKIAISLSSAIKAGSGSNGGSEDNDS
ncbi:component of IIS longevity pathway SMK-1-domain-containing protein [Xylariales sp. PMI_506]|nr:component of IIS longevity pathway SMK-1-domain-containing protein [Xylariales sp. PMI_506]